MEARTRQQTSHWPVVLLIVGSGVVSTIQVGKATVALAAIQTDLGVGLALVSWLLSAFAIVGAVAGVAIGLAVDHVGAKRMAVGGLALQGVCSAAGALSDAAPMLLAARLLEGFGFLAVTVAAPALILDVVPQRARDRVFAIWATFMPVIPTHVHRRFRVGARPHQTRQNTSIPDHWLRRLKSHAHVRAAHGQRNRGAPLSAEREAGVAALFRQRTGGARLDQVPHSCVRGSYPVSSIWTN